MWKCIGRICVIDLTKFLHAHNEKFQTDPQQDSDRGDPGRNANIVIARNTISQSQAPEKDNAEYRSRGAFYYYRGSSAMAQSRPSEQGLLSL